MSISRHTTTSRPSSTAAGGRSSDHFSMSGPTAATSRWTVLGDTDSPEARDRFSEAWR